MHVRCRTGERYNNDCVVLKSNDRRNMIFWGFISSAVVGLLIKCSNHITSEEYKVLEGANIPLIREFGSIHRSHSV